MCGPLWLLGSGCAEPCHIQWGGPVVRQEPSYEAIPWLVWPLQLNATCSPLCFRCIIRYPQCLLHVVSAKRSLILLLSGHKKKMLPLLHLLLCLLLWPFSFPRRAHEGREADRRKCRLQVYHEARHWEDELDPCWLPELLPLQRGSVQEKQVQLQHIVARWRQMPDACCQLYSCQM